MFKPKGPQGVVADKGGSGKAAIPLAERKLPKKKTTRKAKKHKAHDDKDKKGKIAGMLKKRIGTGSIAEDIFDAPKKKVANQFKGGNKGKSTRFVPEQDRMGI